jgi:hypothetical protein
MLSKLSLVSYIESILQGFYSLFAHNPKKFLECTKLVETNHDKNKYTCDNLKLLCDFKLILGLSCFMPMLEVIHTIIKHAQH